MMRASPRLRSADIVNIYRLIAECRDLGCDARRWRSRLLEGLRQMLGARVGIAGEIDGFLTGEPKIVDLFRLGWDHAKGEQLRQQFVEQEDANLDPMLQRLVPLLANRQPIVTRTLVPDRRWRRSIHFNEHCNSGGVSECLYSYHRLPAVGSDVIHVVELHRPLGDRPFSERERQALEWLHQEIAPLIGRQLASAREPSASALSPRLRQVLACLLEGNGEKQAAHRLGIRPATVHEYVQAIYRHFGVSSRGDLLARWIRFGRGAECASASGPRAGAAPAGAETNGGRGIAPAWPAARRAHVR